MTANEGFSTTLKWRPFRTPGGNRVVWRVAIVMLHLTCRSKGDRTTFMILCVSVRSWHGSNAMDVRGPAMSGSEDGRERCILFL